MLLAAIAASAPTVARAGVAYEDPGWDYVYEGDQDAFGPGGMGGLDGQWRHDESDQWDGSAPGGVIGAGNAPGGVVALAEGDTTYLRIQDTGNPLAWGFEEPSNRRFYFGHDVETENPGATSILDGGITLSFRARLSSGGELDDVYPDLEDGEPEFPAYTEITAWPDATGKGYNVKDDGKGMFTVQQDGVDGHAVGFALALDLDTRNNVPGGLVMNNNAGALLPGSDKGLASTANVLPISDASLLDWHEFWITIEGTGTTGGGQDYPLYAVDVYMDGSATPASFVVEGSLGAEYPGQYVAFGLPSESSFGAVDVDFYAYRLGVVVPVPEPHAALAGGVAAGTLLASRRRRRAA
ncbi:MAG: hypothetical protein DCC71_07125 [Proteobacteria bacterium]|nr:MAG: hypothetical protein DCC71_07125 [Pseudomonadota bacterium]